MELGIWGLCLGLITTQAKQAGESTHSTDSLYLGILAHHSTACVRTPSDTGHTGCRLLINAWHGGDGGDGGTVPKPGTSGEVQ